MLGVSFIGDKPRFRKGEIDDYININEGAFLCGIMASDNSGGSLYFTVKQVGQPFNLVRLDGGTVYAANSNEGGVLLWQMQHKYHLANTLMLGHYNWHKERGFKPLFM